MSEKTNHPESYEKAFLRLEEILHKMNEPTLLLDDSLKLFEEATNLVVFCEKKLEESEKKIEILLKSKTGTIQTDPQTGKAMTQSFAE